MSFKNLERIALSSCFVGTALFIGTIFFHNKGIKSVNDAVPLQFRQEYSLLEVEKFKIITSSDKKVTPKIEKQLEEINIQIYRLQHSTNYLAYKNQVSLLDKKYLPTRIIGLGLISFSIACSLLHVYEHSKDITKKEHAPTGN